MWHKSFRWTLPNSVLTVECDSKYQQWDWRMQSMKHRPGTDWPVKSDVRSGTSLISLNDWTTAQVHSVMGSGVPSDVCSALPLLSRHICSLCGGMCIDMQASFLLTFCQCGPCISLSMSNYCWSLSLYIVQRVHRYRSSMQTDISYSQILKHCEYSLTDIWYHSNTIFHTNNCSYVNISIQHIISLLTTVMVSCNMVTGCAYEEK